MTLKIIDRGFQGPGTFLYRTNKNGYIHIEFHKCINLNDNDFVKIDANDKPEPVTFRIYVGNSKIAILHEISSMNTSSELKNIPISENEEVWISTNSPGNYCAHVHRYSRAK